MAPALLAVPLLIALSGAAQAGLPVELPPGEDQDLWATALLMAQQLLPDIELGPALGPGPSVRIVAAEEAWLLDVAGAQGRRVPVRMPIPRTDDARMELLLVCADLLARDEPPAAEPVPEPPPAESSFSWGAPRVAAAFWLPLGAGPQVAGVLEPGGLVWRDLSAAVRLNLASPMHVSEQLSLRTSHLTLALRGSWRERPTIEGGLEGGFCLRRVVLDGDEALRDWTPTLGAGLGLAWPVADGLEASATGGFLADLPPAVLVTTHGEDPLPSWILQLTFALHFTGLTQLHSEPASSPEASTSAHRAHFPRSKHPTGATSG